MKSFFHILTTLFLLVALTGCSGGGSSSDNTDTSVDSGTATTTAALMRTLAPNTTCPDGGIIVDTGIDTNSNGVLETSEVLNSEELCHGSTGDTGPQGAVGSQGIQGPQGDIGSQGAQGDPGPLSDLACNTDQIARFDGVNWVCADDNSDTSPPVVILTAPSSTVNNSEFVTLSITDDTEIAYYVTYDMTPLNSFPATEVPYAITQGKTFPQESGISSLDLTYNYGLFNEDNKLMVMAVDRAGNSTSSTVEIYYDKCSNLVPYANLSGCNFDGMNLSGYDLSVATFTDADMVGTNLTGATLTGAVFTSTLMDSAILDNALMQNNHFNGTFLMNASLDNATLTGAHFEHVDLTDASMDGANLTGGSFSYTDLINTSLLGATLVDVGFSRADLTGAVLLIGDANDVVSWYQTTCPDGTLSTSVGDTCVNNLN